MRLSRGQVTDGDEIRRETVSEGRNFKRQH